MSLSRSFLKSLNLNDDQISAVIEAHSETVTGLNSKYSELETKYNGAKESADRLPRPQRAEGVRLQRKSPHSQGKGCPSLL